MVCVLPFQVIGHPLGYLSILKSHMSPTNTLPCPVFFQKSAAPSIQLHSLETYPCCKVPLLHPHTIHHQAPPHFTFSGIPPLLLTLTSTQDWTKSFCLPSRDNCPTGPLDSTFSTSLSFSKEQQVISPRHKWIILFLGSVHLSSGSPLGFHCKDQHPQHAGRGARVWTLQSLTYPARLLSPLHHSNCASFELFKYYSVLSQSLCKCCSLCLCFLSFTLPSCLSWSSEGLPSEKPSLTHPKQPHPRTTEVLFTLFEACGPFWCTYELIGLIYSEDSNYVCFSQLFPLWIAQQHIDE